LAIGAATIQDVLDRLDRIFSDNSKNGIVLSTIHKSKGLEADRVFIIHSDLMPSKYAKEQWKKIRKKIFAM
jgi:DNA helicase-2/ATP-dependent DNA helicase PcrA